MRWILVIAALAVLSACGGGGGVTVPPSAVLQLAPDRWAFSYSPNMPATPAPALGGAAWQFDFPLLDGVHYLLTSYTVPISGEVSVAVRVMVNDAAFSWPPDACGGSATAHIMVQRNGDDMVADNGRWWGSIAVPLTPGDHVIVLPVQPKFWSNVNGKRGDSSADATAGFEDAMRSPGRIGFTFGGGCFFGHGVWLISGASRFTLLDFQVQ